ncbi:amino acid adenylation domain-containing protein [Streptomyces sp. Ncost-T6T-1]|uniref:amino acid adenylation domain-containing protein n=1 Tax=Streptomyces sp. Ncost-T6T-1 TaxID=1100828 RepID=UPI0008047A8A|nr:amino acid adenylation domain-containing protein [Streptomyces sp. Ncost-T6T-1]SBU98632.1 amino acid adenylation domain-containing protein [Streptomyces sp. Ncost-T6T-1]
MTTRCLHETFEERVTAAPEALAVVSEVEQLTYGQLDARAARMAQRLVDAGVRRGSLVGIHLERGTRMVVAILATLKAGAGYAMLDPQFPVRRLQDMAEDVAPAVVISDSEADVRRLGTSAGFFPVAGDTDRALPHGAVRARPEDIACVIFTSGSTGRPKGVAAPHRAVVGTIRGQTYTRFGPDTVWLQCAPVSWDAFALELWGPLLTGGTCVFHPGRPNPFVIERLVATHGITTMNLPTVLFHVIMEEYPEALTGLKDLLVGGEALSPEQASRLVRYFPELRFVNGYGPVECMVFVTTHRVTAESTARTAVPIGRELAGKPVYVLDEHLRPVTDGEVGELYASGEGIAHGYLGRPGMTAERFVADPFGAPGGRMYRTGDSVRWHSEGPLEFIGRADGQVKIRGVRIDIAEVEAVLGKHPAVKKAVVAAEGERPEDRRLTAYLTARAEQGAELTQSDLRAYAADKMPDFMVPHQFIILDTLPVTHNGKIDRMALLKSEEEGSFGDGENRC